MRLNLISINISKLKLPVAVRISVLRTFLVCFRGPSPASGRRTRCSNVPTISALYRNGRDSGLALRRAAQYVQTGRLEYSDRKERPPAHAFKRAIISAFSYP